MHILYYVLLSCNAAMHGYKLLTFFISPVLEEIRQQHGRDRRSAAKRDPRLPSTNAAATFLILSSFTFKEFAGCADISGVQYTQLQYS